jgi:hypothetical protein
MSIGCLAKEHEALSPSIRVGATFGRGALRDVAHILPNELRDSGHSKKRGGAMPPRSP